MAGDAPYPLVADWHLMPLGALTLKIGSGSTPTGGERTYLPARHRAALIRSQNVLDRRFSDDGLAFISEAQADALTGVALQPDDVLLNITGDGVTFGRSCIVPVEILPAYVNQHVSIVRADKRTLDARYLLAYLTHPSVKHYVESFNAGGSRRAITKGHIESFSVPLAPLGIQHEIGEILDVIDKKIDMNRRTNRTLEDLVTVLFKSWFVDFDPVAAKRDGRPPVGVPADAIDLLPSHFKDSELGPIPQGWRVVPLDSVADFLNGLALQRYPSRDGDELPVIKIAELRARTNMGADRCGGVPPEYVIDDGDVVFSWSGSLMVDVWCGGKGALNQHLFKVTSSDMPKWFYLAWLNEHLPEFQAIAADKATTMGHIRRFHLTEAKVLLPPAPLMKAMTSVQEPLLDQIIHNRLESRALAELRDTLLGPLLSGELTIKTAEKAVGAAL
jgi:type I restriction enzyme, S subunit